MSGTVFIEIRKVDAVGMVGSGVSSHDSACSMLLRIHILYGTWCLKMDVCRDTHVLCGCVIKKQPEQQNNRCMCMCVCVLYLFFVPHQVMSRVPKEAGQEQ